MARTGLTCMSIINTILVSMALTGILQLVLVVSALAERCTRAVPVQKYPPKKVQILRRLPAACSNWDKAWSWITKADCGTKYRMDYVTMPSRDVQYKLEYVCCDGDTECENGENIHSSGFDSTDEKFLAIVLGSTAAAVIIIIVIVAISLCTRKRRCLSMRENGHAYDRAEADDKDGGNVTEEKCCHEDRTTSDEECKSSEPVYAEIGDSTLPRYTDLFKHQTGITPDDPFRHATAPPIASKGGNPGGAANNMAAAGGVHHATSRGASAYTNSSTTSGVPNNGRHSSSSLSGAARDGGEDKYASVCKTGKTLQQVNANGEITETRYYNVREKKKKKKKGKRQGKETTDKAVVRNRGGEEGGATTATHDATEAIRKHRAAAAAPPVTVEMMVKSSSTSESMGGAGYPKRDASLSRQKRRSAPPDSPELRAVSVHNSGSKHVHFQGLGHPHNPTVIPASQHDNHRRRDVLPVCTVHQKPNSSTASSSLSRMPNDGRNTNSLKSQRTGAGGRGGAGGGGAGGAGGAGGGGVRQKSWSTSGATHDLKSPPELDVEASNNRSQSYENIPEMSVKSSTNTQKAGKPTKKKAKSGKGETKTSNSNLEVHSMHHPYKTRQEEAHNMSRAPLPDLPPCPKLHYLPADREVLDHRMPPEEADSISPLLPHPEAASNLPVPPSPETKILSLSCASPLLNEPTSYLSSIPSSQSGLSSDGGWSSTSGRDVADYDTLQYSYDPSEEDEHLYQKLGGLDPHLVPKC